MPKQRLELNEDLPERWRIKHGSIYYRVPPGQEDDWDGRQEFRLGKTFAEALETFNAKVLGNHKLSELHEFHTIRVIKHSRAPVFKLPEKHCIYFLFDNDDCVYVGQTTNLFLRLRCHFQDKQFNAISWQAVDEKLAFLVKAEYVKRLKPKYNIYRNEP